MSKNKKKKSIAVLFLIFAWLLFGFLSVIFYFYFFDDFKKAFTKEEKEHIVVTQYETNAYPEVNRLINSYYGALASCDQKTLQAIVSDPTVYNDMTAYQKKAEAITGYTNIMCYTVPGYNDGDFICYAISNLTLTGITSTPLNINQIYIKKTKDGYIIDNNLTDDEVINFVNTVHQSTEIQGLYQKVKDNVDECALDDPNFAQFYNKVMSE